MAKKPVGEMVISLDLETAAYTKAQQKILSESKEAANTINGNFKRLGVTSDELYAAMATRAEASFRKIGLSAKSSLAEVERSYAAMVSSINTSKKQMAKNPLFETLGIRSVAAIEAQKAAVIASYDAIKTTGNHTAQDLVNIERAKNEKLKELNKEMTGHHEMSLASMQRAVLRFYATMYVASTAIDYLSMPFVKGFKAVEEYNTAIASMAAMVVTFGQNIKELSLEDQWKNALAYSTAIIPVLEKIAAKTLLSGQETIALANAFARSGVFLDENNKKQIDAFTKISNALPLMTQGQEITRQINTEVRSLMTGMNVHSSMMLITLREIDPEIEKHMAQWRATDTVLEHIGELLKGFGPATSIIEKQWQAVKTSLDTTVTQILRGTMKQAYEDIIVLTQELDKWLQTNKQSIADTVDQLRATAKMLKLIYDTAPSGTFEAASMGIIGKILWGNQVGLMIAAISLINSKLKETGNNLGALPKKAFDAWEAIKNIGTRPGPQEVMVPFVAKPALTAQEKANLNVIKIMKMMDETINKNHKESIAEYDKQTKLQFAAFKDAGASENYINKYLEKRKILKEQQFSLDKKSNDDAKKAAEEMKNLQEKIWKLTEDVQLSGLDGSRKAFEQNRIEAEKLRKEFENTKGWDKLTESQKTAVFATIDASQKMKDQLVVNNMVQKSREDNAKAAEKDAAATKKINDDYDRLMNTVAPVTDRTYEMARAIEEITAKFEKGTPAWQEAIDKVKAFNDEVSKQSGISIAQKEADKARKMVTFYKEIGLNRDEYYKASLVWIEKEAKVKELEYGKDFDKAKWVADQKFLLYNEAEKKIYDMQLSYLKDMGQEYTKQYRDIAIMKIKNEADKLEREFQNAEGGSNLSSSAYAEVEGERKKTLLLMDEYAIQLNNYAKYLEGMGDSVGANKAINAAKEMSAKKIEFSNRVMENDIKNQKTMFDKAAWIANETKKLDKTIFEGKMSNVEKVVSGFGKMLDAAMTAYDKESSEYKRLSEWKKGVLIAEQAIEIAKNAQIVASNLGLITSNTGVAISNAGAAVTGASIGVGPTGFATAAAMIALMASVFAMYGIANGSGSTSVSVPTSLPASTVLGAEAGTGSESISKSYELLQDTYDMQYRELADLNSSMSELNSNITGLITSIVKTGLSGSTFDASSIIGNAEQTWLDAADSTIGRIFTGHLITDAIFGENSQIGNFLTKISDTLTNLFGSTLGAIFGGDIENTANATHVWASGGKVGELTNKSNPSQSVAQAYNVSWYNESGGYFGSDNNWSSVSPNQPLDTQTQELFTKVFKGMSKTLVALSKSFGTDLDTALNYAFDVIDIDITGKTTDEINKAFSEAFSNAADTAAQTLFGIYSNYQKVGEGLYETAVRLAIDKEVILDTLEMTRQSFAGTTPEIIAFSESLISMAGDLDTLRSAAETYYDKFFNDSEKQTRLQGQLSASFTAMNLVLPATRAEYRAMVESLNLYNEADQEHYITMMNLAESADQYYTALGDVLDAQNDLTESLKNQQQTIKQWLIDIAMSNLAPAVSAESYINEYNRQKSLAFSNTATEEDVSNYLNYAKTYLEFMRTYGGNYQETYNNVIEDVRLLGDGVDLQIDLAQRQLQALNNIELYTATSAAMAASSANNYTNPIEALYEMILGRSADPGGYAYYSGLYSTGSTLADIANSMYSSPEYTGHASGGYSNVPAIFGEAGGEWAVPTYEPQRSSFLKKAPQSFWDNLGLNGGSNNTDGGEMVIHVHVNVDGKEIGDVVTKQIPRNGDLAGAIRRIAN